MQFGKLIQARLFRLRGQAGLQILTRSGTWTPVPVLPPGTHSDPHPPILINIGDLLSYWTNGLFRSTMHRVVFGSTANSDANDGNRNKDEEQQRQSQLDESEDGYRYSIVYFCHPIGDTPLNPAPCERVAKFIDEGQAAVNPYAHRKVLTAEEHLRMRLSETFGTLFQPNNVA
jgi:isopenicillin N synthase-like dioxygenase